MIFPPSFPPGKNEPAEEQVYNILKRLDPERYEVFYDRRFVGMWPGERKEYQIDFLIADLGGGRFNGLLVLEVKGGIVKYDGFRSMWTQNGYPMKDSDDPVEQAQGNMHSLVKHYPEVSRRVPFGWAVCFPDPRNIYSKKQIPEFLDPIQLLESSALQAIEKQIPLVFNFIREQSSHMQGADMETYRKLKESLLAGLGMVVPLHARLEAEERQLINLTQEQMQLLEMIGHNKRLLVSGPAGCGKTIMATTIARQAREEGLRVLMLTFNRIPAANIRLGLGLIGNEPDLTVDNYHHFAHMIVEEVYPDWWDASAKAGGDDFWEIESAIRFDEVLLQREQHGQEPSWDVIIIDEGQDFRESWLLSLSRLLKPDGRLCIFMDEDQNIFNAFTGLPKGWQFAKFRLPHNCRNTRRIIEQLEAYLEKKIPFKDGTPEGDPVQFFSYRNDVEQVKLVRDRWLQLVNEEGISPARIVLILNTPKEESCLANVNAFGRWHIQAIDRDTGLISPRHVNITTIRTFKGLEADMVFILDTGKMEIQDSRVLYTQASRARLWLGLMEKKFTE